MKAIASNPQTPSLSPTEGGFTVAELLAGLMVASLLMMGIAELTLRYARTSSRITSSVEETRSARLVQNLIQEFERADPETLEVSPNRVSAKLGRRELSGEISPNDRQTALLSIKTPRFSRTVSVPADTRFLPMGKSGVRVQAGPDDLPPIAIVMGQRRQSFDCEFDTVSLRCR